MPSGFIRSEKVYSYDALRRVVLGGTKFLTIISFITKLLW